MLQRWALIVADFQREYQLGPAALASMSMEHFSWLLKGLSGDSRFVTAWDRQPKHLHDPADRAAIIAAARR